MAQDIQTMHFEDDGRIPNNPHLSLVLYRDAIPHEHDRTAACKRMFTQNGWDGMWVNGIFPYHPYHSTAHEVLGVVSGNAEVKFGGEQGETVRIQTGDVVVIPAGVGHCNLDSSADFRVVGAYPEGQDWDLRKGDPDDRPEVLENIQCVPLPQQDPVQGKDGVLLNRWQPADHLSDGDADQTR
jgi:uncharacterized protein YjlB